MSAAARDLATEGNLLAAEVVRSFGELHLRVTGGSMLPALWPGDIVRIEGRDFAKLLTGEVALYRREGRLFLHRIIEKSEQREGRSIIARGDTLRASDPPVPEDCVLGVATVIQRGNRELTLPRSPGLSFRLVRWSLRQSALLQRLLLRLSQRRMSPKSLPHLIRHKIFRPGNQRA